MKDIFVSYTTSDKDTADSLVEYLEGKGYSCFIAPRDVDAGKAYASNIMKAIDECKLVVLVASNAINDSEHVLNEVDVIVEKKRDILPVLIEDFEMNDDYRYYLGRKQWVVAYPDKISMDYASIHDAIRGYLPDTSVPDISKQEESSNELVKTKTVFEYDSDRGIMINIEDHQRNVSFRSDTLINMMSDIFDKVAVKSGEEFAEDVFFSSGYVSGKNFSEKINALWDTGYSEEAIKQKIEKWGQFDSAVGWGKFTVDMDFDNEADGSIGVLSINEAFLVDRRNKRKVCRFFRGYCTGVIENLLASSSVELICRECPLESRFKTHCVFDIYAKG